MHITEASVWFRLAAAAAALLGCAVAAPAAAMEPWRVLAQTRKQMPQPPWPEGDERGMANQIGPATWARCAWHLGQAKVKSYELSYPRSNGAPDSRLDALGRLAFLREPWDGKPPFPAQSLRYYGGFTQAQVKPTPESPLERLGVEKAPPIVTSAVLLDAQAQLGGGQPLRADATVTRADIDAMLRAQGLGKRGVQPGDVVYVRTGWGEHRRNADAAKEYSANAPRLADDAAQYLGERRVVAVGLDTPFIDPMPDGMPMGTTGPAADAPAGMPFAARHHLAQMGVHHLWNAKLDELANDKVWTSCTMILPLRAGGAASAAVRPVAIGVPRQ